MFEDSLMESGGRFKTKSKYWTIVGFVLNGRILAALILYSADLSRSAAQER